MAGTAIPRSTRQSGPEGDTAQRILDTAEQLARVRGFNGFSYAHIAAELGITKASLHYHFPSKGALGEALIARYSDRFVHALAEIDGRPGTAPAKLAAYADLYADPVRGQRMCLCGMLAAEHETLPQPITDALVAFFDANENWLEGVLEQGRAGGSLSFDGSAREAARMIVSGLEGAMLIARPYRDPERFRATARALLAGFAAS
jgi:TetR/AcrR family transcriptional regulator, transcriptional repressor for nem operon